MKLIKSKDFYIVTKTTLNKSYSFELLIQFHGFHKNINILLNINNNKKNHQISILEWFLRDHVTLRTGVMMLKIHRKKKKNILK